MLYVKAFESFEKTELKERPEKKIKTKSCLGKCQRKFYIKEGKPIIHCPSCDRTFSVAN